MDKHPARLLLPCALLASPWAFAAETLSLSYGLAADGSCPEAGHRVSAEYRRDEAGGLGVEAYVRGAPSGTDCTVESLSYDLAVERRFDLGVGGWRAAAVFGAARTSTSAVYELAGWDGPAHLAPTASLPAGAAETLTASLGVARAFGPVEIGAGVNVVPNDWAGPDGPESRRSLALQAAWDAPFGVEIEAEADATEEYAVWGATARWRRDVGDRFGIVAAYRLRGGLGDLHNPAPARRTFVGQRWTAPRAGGRTSSVEVGLEWRLR